jgi:ubiquinone/menaquinone biosynthesis C-methylase UbiE
MTDFIKEFWDDQARTHGLSHSASWGDNFAINLEIENISKHIKDGDKVLDVGCANGYSTIAQSIRKNIDITGVDFSEPMIEQAKKTINKGINFSVGDIRKLPFDSEEFDVTYTTRVLINLPNWEEQLNGIHECLRVTKTGGIIVLSEAFYEPLVLLNAMRQLVQLKPLVEHDFNRYLKKEKLKTFLDDLVENKGIDDFYNVDFSSLYYLGSRFVRELTTEIDKYPGYSNPINEIFHRLEQSFSGGGFGIQQAYIIRK